MKNIMQELHPKKDLGRADIGYVRSVVCRWYLDTRKDTVRSGRIGRCIDEYRTGIGHADIRRKSMLENQGIGRLPCNLRPGCAMAMGAVLI